MVAEGKSRRDLPRHSRMMTVTSSLLLYAPPHLQIPITSLPGIGPQQAEMLASSKFQITSIQELIQHYPRRHLDFSDTKAIADLRLGDEVTVIGEIRKVVVPPWKNKRIPLKVTLSDGKGSISIAFFNQPWRAKQLPVGTLVAAKGKITIFNKVRQMTSPLIDVIRDAGEVVKIVPVYPSTAEIHTAWLRKNIGKALARFRPLEDPLPQAMLDRYSLRDRSWAVGNYHFPSKMSDVFVARKRLVFDELFTLQIGLAYRKRRIEKDTLGIAHKVEAELAGRFIESLPFTATHAQTRAIGELESDMARSIPMNRLLQGEVGSGKTVVALYGALLAVQGGYQAAIMAPTEVLAMQHLLTITALLEPLAGHFDAGAGQMDMFGAKPEVVLLTGGQSAAARRTVLAKTADGSASIVVGTHALIQEGVEFANLGLVVVDEQHRFGVRQRLTLKEKSSGMAPDLLIMTATPIPRTLAHTLYGDLDVSVLDELPAGRKPITTRVIDERERGSAYDLIRAEVALGRQAYVIVPLVDESDNIEARSAIAEATRLAEEVFPDLRVGMMHGKLRPLAKDDVMNRFRVGELDVLISTTVVEVGVDVPNATVMLIEDADRFGLSQLHQLRGRIGRGGFASTCLLFTSVFDDEDARVEAQERLNALSSTNDGFELAEKDLAIRGPGSVLGTRQAGYGDLRLTDLLRDIEILAAARKEAFALIDEDHDLVRHPLIRLEMEGRFADRLEWLFHS